ncbi:hemerythrin domain-containing protein [Streptomyces xanthochromogenes]|uniref:hemerythrin domain-containing protein n=1 Tax=Streptomyces xanthochromogenes TaxID=67384 RepID=UPI0034438921
MCHYCGCREIPLIKEFIAEHERVTDAAGDAQRALAVGDVERARELVAYMAGELETHWRGEEEGLFAVMRRDPEYAAYIDVLMVEHQDHGVRLLALDLATAEGRAEFDGLVRELHQHISREEDGLFPASLTALSGDEWNFSMAAWREARPGA